MGLSHRLEIRQGQTLVMTPQLLQAIKLLQFSHLELTAYVDQELERNPLLERADDHGVDGEAASGTTDFEAERPFDDGAGDTETSAAGAGEAEWYATDLPTHRDAIESSLGTGLDNVFPDDAIKPGPVGSAGDTPLLGLASPWTAGGGSFDDGDDFDPTALLARDISLHEHLLNQLDLMLADPIDRMIGRHLVDAVDEAGYLTEDVSVVADRLSVAQERVERVLGSLQQCEPSGIAARSLAECLTLQLRERDRFDPCMAALVSRLDLVARRDLAALKRVCQVDEDDLLDMLAEIRSLDPKPGRAFGTAPIQVLVPDVFVRPAPDGTWLVELNPDTLPRVLVNQTYFARVSRTATSSQDKTFLTDCLQNANWLARSLEQRARTILKVASEIVRQQDLFFALGVEHLRPLNLKTIADAIGMHESTVSRVTANKSIGTARGVFEMKYFFSAAIAATAGGDAHSAESVRFRIKQMIDAEDPTDVLSDDAIVKRLKDSGIDIARRTVAKYRESLKISSSVERRREKAGRNHSATAPR